LSDSSYDVLVIGAGASGLAAACALARAGKRVAVIEARDRIGGRILTERFTAPGSESSIPIELGAEFIHGMPEVTWELVRRAKLATSELAGAALMVRDGRLTADIGAQDSVGDLLEQMTAWLAKQPAGSDMPFADYLARHAPNASNAAAATNYVEGFNAADQQRIGVAGLAKQQRAEDAIDGDRIFRLTRGYDAIPRFLADELGRAGGVVHLDKPARRIMWSRGAVRVQGDDSRGSAFEYTARQAVVTVPLGVLQAESIAFEPRPDAILREAQRLAMGCAVRVVLVFSSRFWRDAARRAQRPDIADRLTQLGFVFMPGETPATWWTPHPDPAPVLTAWAGGPKAEAWQRAIAASLSPDAALKACLDTLARAFVMPVAELEQLLVAWYAHDWARDDYARGAYSYVPAGALDAPALMTAPVDGTLFFAGEHTDLEGHWGTVHAALASGARAAEAVLASPLGS
jgi:monoamine oxidase